MKYLIKNINEFNDNDINSFVNNINPIKRNKLINMNKKQYKQSIIGEILLSNLLENYNINYNDIIIKYNENGKPNISNYHIYYNISYDEDLVICVINDTQIGVNIERLDDVIRYTAKEFTSLNEYNYITNKYQYYEIKTLKKAYIKLFGLKIDDIKNLNIVFENKIKLNVVNKTFKYNNYLISICYLPK